MQFLPVKHGKKQLFTKNQPVQPIHIIFIFMADPLIASRLFKFWSSDYVEARASWSTPKYIHNLSNSKYTTLPNRKSEICLHSSLIINAFHILLHVYGGNIKQCRIFHCFRAFATFYKFCGFWFLCILTSFSTAIAFYNYFFILVFHDKYFILFRKLQRKMTFFSLNGAKTHH